METKGAIKKAEEKEIRITLQLRLPQTSSACTLPYI
jgi:hypothetical protein